MAKPNCRYRVEISNEGKAVLEGWASFKGDSCLMDNDYPDAKPDVGMSLSCRLGMFKIVAVNGKSLKLKGEG